jgi:hypothetical protein
MTLQVLVRAVSANIAAAFTTPMLILALIPSRPMMTYAISSPFAWMAGHLILTAVMISHVKD